MDINLPLILLILVLVSGGLWLLDWLFLAKRRADTDKEPVPIEYAKSFFPVLLLVFLLRSFLIEPFQIPSESMVPTLEVGDFIAVSKFAYGIRLPVIRTKIFNVSEPKRGDIMVFFPPHESRYFIKRVIGLPGDEIRYINNVLYINGEKMPQTFVASTPSDSMHSVMRENIFGTEHLMRKRNIPGQFGHNGVWTVPEGYYFMMGDNRDNSADSRSWGAVPEKNIVGKAFAIWMHRAPGSWPSFKRVGAIE